MCKSSQNEYLCVSDRIGNWKLALDLKHIYIAAEGQAPNEKNTTHAWALGTIEPRPLYR